MIRGIRVMLLAAGLPHCYWPFAAKYYAFMRTIIVKNDDSIYAKRHNGDHFEGPRIPFGALVRAMPSAIHDNRRMKFDHPMQPAVFLGYIVQPGCKWYREFVYVFLDDIAQMSFYRKVKWSKARVTVHSGREVIFEHSLPLVYPCKPAYQRDNETVSGLRWSFDEMSQEEERQDGDEYR